MKKISECSAAVQKILDVANSLPEGFSVNVNLNKLDNAENEKREFYKAYKILPAPFIKNNEWIRHIIDGNVLEPDKTPAELQNKFGFAKRKITIQKLAEVWVQFTPDLMSKDTPFAGDAAFLMPNHRLKIQILWAKAVKETLHQVINDNKNKSSNDALFKYSAPTFKDGVYSFTALYPMDVFLDEQTDTKRIRYCGECKTFFWVKRLSANIEETVCENCRVAVKLRKSRKKNSISFNEKRRLKRYKNAGRTDYCDKCIFPFDRWGCTLTECNVKKRGK